MARAIDDAGTCPVATYVACALGSPAAFIVALVMVLAWAIAGLLVGHSEYWQLVIGTVTGIATFLMLFLLQNSKNRDTKAIHIKLDELLRAIEGARTGLANVGEMSDAEIEKLEGEFRSLASEDQAASARGEETGATTAAEAVPPCARAPSRSK